MLEETRNQRKMARKKPTIEQLVGAILERDRGTPYSQALEAYDLTPNQFFTAVQRDLQELARLADKNVRQTLEQILTDKARRTELFRMEEELIQQQYSRRQTGTQKKFYNGTYTHPENVELLVYHALTTNNPQLASTNRTQVLETIKKLPTDLAEYLHSIGLTGLMKHWFKQEEKSSPLAVLKAFDMAYQRNTGKSSLFDKTQPQHIEFDKQNRLVRR